MNEWWREMIYCRLPRKAGRDETESFEEIGVSKLRAEIISTPITIGAVFKQKNSCDCGLALIRTDLFAGMLMTIQ